MNNGINISQRKTDLFIYLISGFIMGSAVLFYMGTLISKNIQDITAYLLFWTIYIITLLTIGNTIFNYYSYNTLSDKDGLIGSIGEKGLTGDKGDDGECDRDCTLKSYSITAINRLNKEYNKVIGKITGKEPYPYKIINNAYIKDMVRRIVDSDQFKEISQIKHPAIVLNYVVEVFVKWFEIIANADKSEGKKHFQDYMDVYGEHVEWESIITDDKNPFHEIEKYDLFYWGLDKEFHPIKIKSCLKDNDTPSVTLPPKDPPPIKAFKTNMYEQDYNDAKTGADRNVATWITKPLKIKGETFYSLGSVPSNEWDLSGGNRFIEKIGGEYPIKYNFSGGNGPAFSNVVISADSKWIRKPHPDHWSWKWNTERKKSARNTFRKKNYKRATFWNAEDFYEDNELYRCFGSMIAPTQDKVNPSQYYGRENVPFVCVNDKALEEIPINHSQIWNDSGAGTKNDGSIFFNQDGEYNLLYFQNGYDPNYNRKMYKLKKEFIDDTFFNEKFYSNLDEKDPGLGLGFQDVKYNKTRKHGLFDLLDLVVKSPIESLYTNQKLFIEHTGLNNPNSYFVKTIEKETNTPIYCLKINDNKLDKVECNALQDKQIWEIEFLGQSKEVCLIKSIGNGKYLNTKRLDNFLISGDIPDRNINNVKLKPFLWRVTENK